MKAILTISTLTLACATVVHAAGLPTDKQLQAAPKNLARQHYSTTVQIYDAATQKYVANQASAAWLDDDATTGWPTLPGKQHYLVSFAQPQLVTSFAISAKKNDGTVSIYAAETAAAPGDKAWTLLAGGVPVETINQRKFARNLSKTTKYLLIETDIADPGPIYSLYVYGGKSVASENIVNRPQPVDINARFGEYVNDQTAFSVASLYARARVSYLNDNGSNIPWQRAIDDNPETLVNIQPSKAEAGMIVTFDGGFTVSRLSLLTEASTRGKAEVYLLSEAPGAAQSVGLEGVQPSFALNFDGSSNRQSVDFAETKAVAFAVRWTPTEGNAPLSIRELAVFSDLSLASYEVGSAAPLAIAQANPQTATEVATGEQNTTKTDAPAYENAGAGEGKETVQISREGREVKLLAGDGKRTTPLDKVAEGSDEVASGPGGYRRGGIGFPPRIPRSPVSPE